LGGIFTTSLFCVFRNTNLGAGPFCGSPAWLSITIIPLKRQLINLSHILYHPLTVLTGITLAYFVSHRRMAVVFLSRFIILKLAGRTCTYEQSEILFPN
jgi:hypothetical protein